VTYNGREGSKVELLSSVFAKAMFKISGL
jgi:hypothetical protein